MKTPLIRPSTAQQRKVQKIPNLVMKIKVLILRALNRIIWPIRFRQFRKIVNAGKFPNDTLLRSLVYRWGNAGWSADISYLRRLLEEMLAARQYTVLECGSGLTTVLLGVVADRQGHKILSLEHHPGWHERISETLEKASIKSVDIYYCPLKDYGKFDWYDLAAGGFPNDCEFDLVICDGPPGTTKSGRLGLPYVMASSFRDHCVIIADDAHRPGERQAINHWISDFNIVLDKNRSHEHFDTLVFNRSSPPALSSS